MKLIFCKKNSNNSFLHKYRPYVFAILAISVIFIVMFNLFFSSTEKGNQLGVFPEKQNDYAGDGLAEETPENRATFSAGLEILSEESSKDPDVASSIGNYIIVGYVMDEGGHPVSGIPVAASPIRFYGQDELPDMALYDEKFSTTDASGLFQFENLLKGEYQLRTERTDFYLPSSVSVLAGVEDARITVVEERTILISGTVVDPADAPLPNVNIFLGPVQNNPVAVTNSSGSFVFNLPVRSDQRFLVSINGDGYKEKKLSISYNDWRDHNSAKLTVVLVPIGLRAVVSGKIFAPDGSGVSGEWVNLQNAQKQYRSVTDETGAFVFNDVTPDGNYALWLVPKENYKKYRQEGLMISAYTENTFTIALESIGFGSLNGTITDFYGQPVPAFTLLVRSENAPHEAAQQVTSDQSGFYFIDNVPDGRVRFETLSFPRFVISGIELPAGKEAEVDLLLDLGDNNLEGRVVDSNGDPVAGADVILSWKLSENGLVYQSTRKTATNAAGDFLLSGMGRGLRTLAIHRAGFQTARLEQDLDHFPGKMEIVLEPAQ